MEISMAPIFLAMTIEIWGEVITPRKNKKRGERYEH
jgi:hypothetical protein